MFKFLGKTSFLKTIGVLRWLIGLLFLIKCFCVLKSVQFSGLLCLLKFSPNLLLVVIQFAVFLQIAAQQ